MDATSVIEKIRQYTDQQGLDAALTHYTPELANWPGESAGCWFRVSPGHDQEEALQVPQVLRYCATNSLRPVKFYIVHAKSAFHGQHQDDLNRALEDAKEGAFSVLVIWRSDRLERRHERQNGESETLPDTLAEFADAGCKVLSVQEPGLGNSDFGSQVSTYIASLVNRDKSERISADVKMAQEDIRARNANTYRIPWGYISTPGTLGVSACSGCCGLRVPCLSWWLFSGLCWRCPGMAAARVSRRA